MRGIPSLRLRSIDDFARGKNKRASFEWRARPCGSRERDAPASSRNRRVRDEDKFAEMGRLNTIVRSLAGERDIAVSI